MGFKNARLGLQKHLTGKLPLALVWPLKTIWDMVWMDQFYKDQFSFVVQMQTSFQYLPSCSPNIVYMYGVLSYSLRTLDVGRLRGDLSRSTFVHGLVTSWGSPGFCLGETVAGTTFDRKKYNVLHRFASRGLWPLGCLLECMLGCLWFPPRPCRVPGAIPETPRAIQYLDKKVIRKAAGSNSHVLHARC